MNNERPGGRLAGMRQRQALTRRGGVDPSLAIEQEKSLDGRREGVNYSTEREEDSDRGVTVRP